MPRATEIKTYNNGYVKGLITEASALTFPENATTDEDNCILYTKGNRRRRLGIDYEQGYSLSTYSFDNADIGDTEVVSTNIWENAGGNSNINFLVVQVGLDLYFYDLAEETLSDGYKSFTVDMTSRAVSGASLVGAEPVYATAGKGALFVVGEKINPFYITYDSGADSITVTNVDLRIRDLDGTDDSLDIDENPTTLSATHQYNLYNQGWRNQAGGLENAHLTTYFNALTNYPDNTQIWHASANATDNSFGSTEATNLSRLHFGTTPAPKGHYILDPFIRDRETASGLSGIDSDGTNIRSTACAFHSGRFWYAAGNGEIYFSQIVKKDFSNVGYAYQEADPTSYEDSALVDSDGGVVNIPEAGTFVAMRVIGPNLVIWAENGIWFIGGGSGGGFKATDYSVSKVASIDISSFRSLIDVEGLPVWWSNTGIYTLEIDSVSSNFKAVSLTETTIQEYFINIDAEAKQNAVGAYDSANKVITWLYRNNTDGDNTEYKNKVLNFNLTLKAFYPWTISDLASSSPYLVSLFSTPALNNLTVTSNVIDNDGDTVVDSSDDQVIADVSSVVNRDTSVKYMCIKPNGASSKIVFALFNNGTFYDWVTDDSTGVTYSSYMLTGHELNNDVARFIQAPYIYCYFNKTETGYEPAGGSNYNLVKPSSCFLTARWNWSDHQNANRWSTEQQVYRFRQNWEVDTGDLNKPNGYAVTVSRSKIRGKGQSLQLYFRSEDGKDFDLLGWAIKYAGNTDV
jgi:hypothetical protein